MVRQALDHTPNGDSHRASYLDTLAEILMAQNRFIEALNVLDQAEALATQADTALLSHIYEHKARAYEALGQLDSAQDARHQASIFSPSQK